MMDAFDSQAITENNVSSTRMLSAIYTMNSDIIRFESTVPDATIPGKRRMFRIYMPQEVEPLVFTDIQLLVLGRESASSGNTSVLDLSMQYGQLLGVSRKHAQIMYQEGNYLIQDMNSRNGTYLNKKKLTPEQTYVLHSGDEIRMGHFVMVIACDD